jgi:hypothetical protein
VDGAVIGGLRPLSVPLWMLAACLAAAEPGWVDLGGPAAPPGWGCATSGPAGGQAPTVRFATDALEITGATAWRAVVQTALFFPDPSDERPLRVARSAGDRCMRRRRF